MKLTEAIKSYALSKLQPKAFDPLENINLNNVAWRSVGGSSAYAWYQDNQYENGYSSISKLANGFAVIEPYTIDKAGDQVPSNILNRLYTPNTSMSAFDFREALAVCSLVHDKVRLKVHHTGTRINAESITGFTFMEGYIETIVEGKRIYKLPNGESLTDESVITLKSVNPNAITEGFSASRAARRWTRLDDYIADYQKGFFENGAVPSGQLVITARTTGEFNDIVDTLQARHKGSGKNNNITYTHRPTDQNGAPLNSQIEWIPFSTQNKDMALKDLFENVNRKIDSVYGVPEEIRGHLSNSNYSSVAVAEKVFVKYALYPMSLKIWQKFTHELNRVTGGTGLAIAFHLDVPVIADEEKVNSEAKQLDATTVTNLTAAGFTLDSAIEYVKYGEPEALKLGELPKPEEPEILSPEEARGTPEQPIDIYAKAIEYTDRRLSELKAHEKHTEPVKKQLDVIDKELYQYKFAGIVREQMSRQVNRAIERLDEALKSKAYGDTTEEEDKVFTAELLALMIPLMVIYGNKTTNTGMNLVLQAGLNTTGITRFELSPAQRKSYETYLAKIGTSYADQTAEQIRQVLGDGILNGQTKAEIEDRLRGFILGPENEFRVQRLARTEVNLAEGRASVYSMQKIQSQTGFKIYKVWNTSSAEPCPFCQEMNGKEVLVDQDFLAVGDEVKAGDAVFENNWTRIESAELHANCNCFTTYKVERS